MLAYHCIEMNKEGGNSETAGGSNKDVKEIENTQDKLEMAGYLLEQIIKKHKSHRAARIFDLAYINAIINEMKVETNNNGNEICFVLSVTDDVLLKLKLS
jgi:hypothetical protein